MSDHYLLIAVPEANVADANALAVALTGDDGAQARTFGAAAWRDKSGNRYAVACAAVERDFLPRWQQALPVGLKQADPLAARRAQAKIALSDGTARVTPDRIVAVVLPLDHAAIAPALAAAGLTPIQATI